jgi:amidophosphoribosyltransferase
MCGIVGLFLKNPALEPTLGRHLKTMLIEMTERGPDSAGFAIYGDPAPAGTIKLSLLADDPRIDWQALVGAMSRALRAPIESETAGDHAVLTVAAAPAEAQAWLTQNQPDVTVIGSGRRMTVHKGVGTPAAIADRFDLANMTGSHAIGHTRMATESAITSQHAHPHSAGLDTCLVHNGSLSNHNRWRRWLERRGLEFQSDNDTEVGSKYIAHRLAEGASLREALHAAFRDLDGFYSFIVGTETGFAVARDGIACKPAVLAETKDWVAVASEYRALAKLPGIEHAALSEPKPATVYSWDQGLLEQAA